MKHKIHLNEDERKSVEQPWKINGASKQKDTSNRLSQLQY